MKHRTASLWQQSYLLLKSSEWMNFSWLTLYYAIFCSQKYSFIFIAVSSAVVCHQKNSVFLCFQEILQNIKCQIGEDSSYEKNINEKIEADLEALFKNVTWVCCFEPACIDASRPDFTCVLCCVVRLLVHWRLSWQWYILRSEWRLHTAKRWLPQRCQ